jgi:hypothetical protein
MREETPNDPKLSDRGGLARKLRAWSGEETSEVDSVWPELKMPERK